MSERDDRAAAIRARWAETTPGPWEWDGTFVATVDERGMEGIVADGCDEGDGEAIAHAPEDVAWLLAEVERLTVALASADPDGLLADIRATAANTAAEHERLRAEFAGRFEILQADLDGERRDHERALAAVERLTAERGAALYAASGAHGAASETEHMHTNLVAETGCTVDAIRRLRTERDAAIRERDGARAEVERLRAGMPMECGDLFVDWHNGARKICRLPRAHVCEHRWEFL